MGVARHSLIPTGMDDPYGDVQMRRAEVFEVENTDFSTVEQKKHYKYTTFDRAPSHHRKIADLAILGRSVEQIASLYMGPMKTLKKALRDVKTIINHPPVAEYIARELERVNEAKEAVLSERGKKADLGFNTIDELVTDRETPAKVRLDGAKWLAERDPHQRYDSVASTGGRNLMHTDALGDFFQKHEQLKQTEAIDVKSKQEERDDEA